MSKYDDKIFDFCRKHNILLYNVVEYSKWTYLDYPYKREMLMGADVRLDIAVGEIPSDTGRQIADSFKEEFAAEFEAFSFMLTSAVMGTEELSITCRERPSR